MSSARPVKAQRHRLAVEGAKHHRHAAVLGHMRRRLVTAAGEIEIDDRAIIENAQRVEPLGRR